MHNAELSAICQQLLSLQSSMAKEKARLQSILDEKDERISSQKSELDRLNLLINSSDRSGKKKKREPSPKVEVASAQGQGQLRSPIEVGGGRGGTLDRHRPPGSSSTTTVVGSGVRIHGSSFRFVAFIVIQLDDICSLICLKNPFSGSTRGSRR